jgi:hypothetical protein
VLQEKEREESCVTLCYLFNLTAGASQYLVRLYSHLYTLPIFYRSWSLTVSQMSLWANIDINYSLNYICDLWFVRQTWIRIALSDVKANRLEVRYWRRRLRQNGTHRPCSTESIRPTNRSLLKWDIWQFSSLNFTDMQCLATNQFMPGYYYYCFPRCRRYGMTSLILNKAWHTITLHSISKSLREKALNRN